MADEPHIDYRFSGPTKLGIRYCIDTNVVIDRGYRSDVDELFALAADGWVNLAKTDALDTERTDVDDDDLVAQRLLDTAGIIELLGVGVLDHSRIGYFVIASGEDVAAGERLWSDLFPGVERHGARKNHVRDVMHVDTAIRYGCEAFVTSDATLLGRRVHVRDRILIYRPDEAVARVKELKRRHEIVQASKS